MSDQARSLDFYVGKLGFEKRRDTAFGEGRWLEVAPPSAATSIALISASDGSPIGVDTGIRLTTEDAEAAHAALLAEGVDADPGLMRMGAFVPSMFTFRDPDGNRLVIVQQGCARNTVVRCCRASSQTQKAESDPSISTPQNERTSATTCHSVSGRPARPPRNARVWFMHRDSSSPVTR